LTGKKSNEIIQGGISSIKSAATSVAKKLDEIKEAISANSTPVKTTGLSNELAASEDDLAYDDGSGAGRSRRVSNDLDIWGRLNDSRKSSYTNLVPLGESNTNPNLPENIYPQVADVSFYFWFFKAKIIFISFFHPIKGQL
jgi:DENN domain-containing protein 4